MVPFRIKMNNTFIKSILLFPIFTLFQSISYFNSINRIWMVFFLFTVIWNYLNKSVERKYIVILVVTFILHLMAFIFTEGSLYNTNIIFYFALWVLVYCTFAMRNEEIEVILEKNTHYINGILYVWTIIVFVSALLPSGYEISWGGERYFGSFTGSVFRLMPSALAIFALAMYMSLKTSNRKYELFFLMPAYSAFMGGSRTYFGVFICILVAYLYMRIKDKKRFYLMLAPLTAILIIVTLSSSIGSKMLATSYTSSSYLDFWGTITNGRTLFWKADLEAFFSLPWWQQFVGNGFNFVYQVNASVFNAIWAHNDFINLLMNFGYLGLLIYLVSFYLMFKQILNGTSKNARIPKLIFLIAVLINSTFNMSYTYLCAMISYPIFMYAIRERYSNTCFNAGKRSGNEYAKQLPIS